MATSDKDPLPTTNILSAEAYTAATAVPVTITGTGVTLLVTSPAEGSVVNGTTPVSATLNDPSGRVTAVRFETYNDRYHYQISWGTDAAAPYGFTPNLGLYPSGEYRHVAKAIDAQGVVLATADVMVTFAHSCYYALQDMALSAPTASAIAGQSFTLSGTLKNNERGNCAHIYRLLTIDRVTSQSTLPVGWTATFDPVEPFSTGISEIRSYTMNIQVPSSAAAGTYEVGAVSNRSLTGFTVIKKVSVSVVRPSGGGGRIPVDIE